MAKIALIAGYAPSLLIFRGALLKSLVDAGHDVMAMAPEDLPAIAEKLRGIGVQYHVTPFARATVAPFGDLRAVLRLRDILKQHQVDTLLTYTIKPVIYGTIAAWLAGVPQLFAMITGRGYVFISTQSKARWLRAIIQPLYRLALSLNTAVFFQNADDLEFFRSSGMLAPRKRAVVLNGSGVPLDHYREDPFPSQKLRFLLIARLLVEKGIREYLAAAQKIAGLGHPIECHLVGPFDPSPGGISECALAALPGFDQINYHGAVEDVRPHLAACHIYVLPSYAEGMPRTVLEAMATGRPIITTDAPGCRETIRLTAQGMQQQLRGDKVMEGENGFLIKVRDTDALVAAMLKFVKEPERIPSRGHRSREIAEARFDVNRVNQDILSVMLGQT